MFHVILDASHLFDVQIEPEYQVSAALKALTLLYIGGASSTAELLSCQSEDGGEWN